MEQVYNFSSSGDVNGKEYNYWVELKACVLTNGKQTIDNREINMTAFRIYPEIRNNQTFSGNLQYQSQNYRRSRQLCQWP